MTTTTVWSDAGDFEVTSFSTTYATARDHGGSDEGITANATLIFVGQNYINPTYYCIEMFLAFDTSSIADTDVVSTGVLSLWGISDNDPSNLNAVTARAYDWGGTAEVTDFRTASQLLALTSLATVAAATYASSAYFSFTTQAGMAGNINKTGFTRMVVHSDRHAAGTAPSGDEYWQINSGDNTGTTSDPKLVITHDPPVGHPTGKRYGGVQFAGAGRKGMW
jgi:hypothetical protein